MDGYFPDLLEKGGWLVMPMWLEVLLAMWFGALGAYWGRRRSRTARDGKRGR